MWMLSFLPDDSGRIDSRHINIMSTTFPWELAVDAALDFMDRLNERRIPRDVTEPEELMAMCVQAARRQR